MSINKNFSLDLEMFEEILDQLPIGALVLDSDGTIQRFNRYEEQLSGLSREQTIGRSFFSDVAPCTKDIELGPRFHEGIAQNNLDIDVEFSFPYPYNRVPRDVHIRAVSVSNGERDAHVVLIEDITSRKQLERNNADMMAGLRSMISAERHKRQTSSNKLTMGNRESFEVEAFVLYANITDYSNAASQQAPAELFKVLDRRMRTAIEIIHRRGGEIDEVCGDGIMAYFTADESNPERLAFDVSRAGWALANAASENGLELPFRVGIAHGRIANGPIGRIEFGQRTSIGRPIVLSKALAQLARPNELLVSEDLYDALKGAAGLELLRGVAPTGVPQPGDVYRVTDLDLPMGA
jgi:photoactive yellow protein